MGYYEIPPQQLRAMQRVGLDMLLYFDGFCREHGLTYYLCGGCCIGAVRTGGFIPWDDDVDIFMPRRDYETLKALWRDTPDYAIQYPAPGHCTRNQFVTISAENTTFIKSYQATLDIRHGVMLDVLPLDGCPRGIRRTFQKLHALVYSLFVVGQPPEHHGRAVTALGRLALALVPSQDKRDAVWRFCEKRMSRYPIEQCRYITELCSGPHYMQNEYPAAAFHHAERRAFEGHMLPVPAGVDGYLSMAFGDYMRLPPPEQQVCHHEYEYLDLSRGYREYRGVYYCTEADE